MRELRMIAALFLVLAASCLLLADGTLSTAELLDTLSQSNAKLVQTLREGFDLDKDAEGVVIGRAVNPALAGARIGPYTLHGHLKNASAPVDLVITLNTEIVFSDRQGRKTAKVALATHVNETLKSIDIETAK
jgi:hypothetical protein